MKKYIFLTLKYLRAYPKRCIGLSVCISMLMFAFITILWYRSSYQYSLSENAKLKNGAFTSISYYCDKELVFENKDELSKIGAGIMNVYNIVDNDKTDGIRIGYADSNTVSLIPIEFEAGSMPKENNEIAVEKYVLNVLEIEEEIGKTIKLDIKDTDGTVKQREYVLTGIIKNYSNKLTTLTDITTDYEIPSVLTAENIEIEPLFIHIFAKQDSYITRNLNCRYTYFASGQAVELEQKAKISDMIILPMAVFFVVTIAFGLFSITSYFFKNQEEYLKLLNILGFSERKARKWIFFESTMIWTGSITAASIFSFVMMNIISAISSFSSNKLYIVFDISPVLIGGILGLTIIIISMNIHISVFFRKTNKKYVRRKPKKQTDLLKCWHRVCKKRYRFQNITCMLLIFFYVSMSIIGSFLPLFYERGSIISNPEDSKSDYSLYVKGGSSSEDTMFIEFPTDIGVSGDETEKLLDNPNIDIIDASIGSLCNLFFLSSKNPEHKLLNQYVNVLRMPDMNYTLEAPETDKMIELAGGVPTKDCLVCLPVSIRALRSVECNMPEVKINEENYKNGLEIIGNDSWCSIGDEFTFVIPIPDEEATAENIHSHIKFKVCTVRVGATYHSDIQSDYSEKLIISSEYIRSVNPNLNYCNVSVKNKFPNDTEKAEKIEDNISYIAAISKGIQYDNKKERLSEFYNRVYSETIQLVVCIVMFSVVILIAIIISSYVQVLANMNSYKLMMKLGGDIKIINKLILSEINKVMSKGIVSGSIFGLLVCGVLSLLERYIKVWDIYLFYVIPIFTAAVLTVTVCIKFFSKINAYIENIPNVAKCTFCDILGSKKTYRKLFLISSIHIIFFINIFMTIFNMACFLTFYFI